ncbi:BAG family molecular chaperone regulator 1 [Caenorhabditis elegans]|uniref:BAG family molecular chaperone regulator 1 n=2 Tax=Caenorhabditis elegans TaxID=6239 RepID=BAG1_CAEEL|nr:BAG family molecular chaperone regulator 1 [Caenorhabditis elegans]O44739.1 RecName: Full=BAG family molecular chaperone regulator 1 [Caenorhabditis elegans]AAD16125.1 BAG-family molecular chaperone regulator-1 [Caenorhabditis elegans]CCD71479.1 BAG family molecular chaperone regulator 1 [Caenorhabditis elegans]|eukprot:NP_491893.1 BAG family molecular chaperone regulator 1 [Caenorhabditis elegans]
MKVNVSCSSVQTTIDILEENQGEDESILTLGQLRDRIATDNDVDVETMKLLHRGKFLQGADDVSLSTLNFKENDKIIVMGGKNALVDDAGFKMLMQYEKHNLSNLQKAYDLNLRDVADLERGFLEKPKQVEMGKKLEKKVKYFNEEAERHLETLDGMNIITETTPENQAKRNREKRKTLVNGIQTLLNQNDALLRRLQEYQSVLNGDIPE